ncbi:MAG: hypothetical protein ABI835_07265, partial [Chloroflexota bacterium]
ALLAPLMVLPSVISVGGLPPSHMRSLGMVPLIFVLVALGAEWWFERLQGWFGRRIPRARHAAPLQGIMLLVIGVLLVGGVLVGDLYFRWAARAELFYETDADLAAAAHWLVDQHVAAGTPVYVAAHDKGHPTVMIEPVPPVTWIGTDSIFRPAPGETGLYIFPHSAPPPSAWLGWLEPGAIADLPLAPDGQPAFWAFRVSGDAPLPVSASPLSAHNRYLSFAGLDAPALESGTSGSISMAWRVDQPPPFGDLTPLLTLEDAHGSLISRSEAYMAGTNDWRAGETLIQRVSVTIPPATPPGSYILRIAWIERSDDSYASYLDASGGQGAVWAQIGTLAVTRPAVFPDPSVLPIAVRQEVEIAPGVRLLGWSAPPESLRPGETLPITLYWQALAPARPPFMLHALLRSAQGDTLLWAGQPVDDRYSAEQWAQGEVLADPLRWTIPRELPAGAYTLLLESGGNSVTMGVLDIAGVARLFNPPAVDQRLDTNFGDQVLLYGAQIERTDNRLSVQLVWQALDAPNRDYKVFVHAVDASGVILAQDDAMPQANTYPTRLWLPGEFVPDSYQLPQVEGVVALRIGLYDPDDGARLSVLAANGTIVGDYIEIRL